MSDQTNFVENMAQEQLRYENIFQRQNDEALSVKIPEFEAAVLEFQNSSPFFAKPGQRWEPAQGNVDDYLRRCDEICNSVPQNVNEFSLPQVSQIFAI